jgi:hypothetical protein
VRKIHLQAVGADPEVFLLDKEGKPFSAEGLFGGTKHEPKPMEGLAPGFFIQEDNVSAEFNIPPAKEATDFAHSILRGLSYINKVAKSHSLKPVLASALHFDEKQLSTPHAQTLGCEPDYNIWSLSVNARPTPPATLRTAAGHVHVSWVEPDDDQRLAMVRALDVFLGVPSILSTKKNERRSLYGKAGAFRTKEYGVEYRTLDNFWLGRKDWCQFVFNGVKLAVSRINSNGDFLLEDLEEKAEDIQDTINNFNKDKAIRLMEHFNAVPFPV